MIVRATSDLHLRRDNAAFVFAALAQLEADARETGGTTLILGDVLDQAKTVHMPTWNRLRMMLRHWPGKGVIVLAGNHDQYSWPDNAVDGLAGGACRVVNVPTASELGVIMPYVPVGRWSLAANQQVGPTGSLPFVWCHQGFRGAYLNNMRRDTDGVQGSAVGDRWVITGHYHLPHAVGRVIYTGSPFEHSFSEEGQVKGWLRWADITTNPIPQRVAFTDTGAPRHITVHWHPDRPIEAPPRRSVDRVRVRTGVGASVARKAASQLTAAGLDGVAVLARPDEAVGRGVVRVGMTRSEQIDAYLRAVEDGHQHRIPPTEELIEWARTNEILTAL